jgi:hypothetical protein
MTVTYRSDIADRALRRIPGLFKSTLDTTSYVLKPEYEKFLRVFLEELQEVYDAFYDILGAFSIDDAIGAQLDLLGIILNERRQGLDDDDYRQILKLKTYLISSDGTISDVIDAVADLTGGTLVRFTEPFPAAVNITTNGLLASQSILDKVGQLVGAGIEANVTTVTGDPFSLSDEPYSTPAAGSGLDRFTYATLDTEGRGFSDYDAASTPEGNITSIIEVNTVDDLLLYEFDIAAKNRVTQVIGTAYTVSYTSDGTATAEEIIDGLAADFNANVNINTLFEAVNVADVLIIREIDTSLMVITEVSAELTLTYAGEMSDRHIF